MIYNQKVAHPPTLPLNYGAYEWVISTWWTPSQTPRVLASAANPSSRSSSWYWGGFAGLVLLLGAAHQRAKRDRTAP